MVVGRFIAVEVSGCSSQGHVYVRLTL